MEKFRRTPSLIMILLVLLLATAGWGHAYKVQGQEKNGACVCEVNSAIWAFPSAKYDAATELIKTCQNSLQLLQKQTLTTGKKVPEMEATLKNVQKRMEKFQYLNDQGLYNALHLKQLSEDIQKLDDTMNGLQDGQEARRIRKDLQKFKVDVDNMYKKKVFNLETMRNKLRYLNNRVQACMTIPRDFKSSCSQRIMSNISAPLVTKLNPLSSSYLVGAWGHDPGVDGEETYWILNLPSSNMLAYYVYFYPTYEDIMAGTNSKYVYLADTYTHANAVQGPGSIVYKGVVYYQCYNKPDLCAFDLKTNKVRRLTLPGAGFNNKFPYCYYSCLDWTDINLSADDKGLWVIYATEANHGNVVVSRVDFEGFNITHTWKTRLFKRSVTNAFMVCGVLYATRFINTYKEEVFYAFDTTTGMEDNTLSIQMDKVAAGVANLHYDTTDRRIYMYNGGYMLAYQAYF